MSAQQLPRLTVEFLEETAGGLRRVSQANWPVKLYISSQSALPTSLKLPCTQRIGVQIRCDRGYDITSATLGHAYLLPKQPGKSKTWPRLTAINGRGPDRFVQVRVSDLAFIPLGFGHRICGRSCHSLVAHPFSAKLEDP